MSLETRWIERRKGTTEWVTCMECIVYSAIIIKHMDMHWICIVHPRPALLRSPSWRSLAQAEADEMSPTVRYSGGGHAGNRQIGARYRQINCESTIKRSKISIGIQKFRCMKKFIPKCLSTISRSKFFTSISINSLLTSQVKVEVLSSNLQGLDSRWLGEAAGTLDSRDLDPWLVIWLHIWLP